MPSHHLITDPDLHEPKGVSTAVQGMVYMANGAGSGTWKFLPFGSGTYQSGTPAQIVTTTLAKLAIDGLGSLTETDHLPREIRGVGELWSRTQYKILPIKQFDAYQVSINIPVTADSGTPKELTVLFDAGGGAAPTDVILTKRVGVSLTTPYTVSVDAHFVVNTINAVNNGIQVFVRTDVGSITLGLPIIQITRVSDGSY